MVPVTDVAMDFEMEDVGHILNLPEEMQLAVIKLLDNKSKRSFRGTCREIRNLLNQHRCMDYSEKFYCCFHETILANGWRSCSVQKHFFRNENAILTVCTSPQGLSKYVQREFANIDTMRVLHIEAHHLSQPIELAYGKMKVKHLDLNVGNTPNIVNGFLKQFDSDYIKSLHLHESNLGEEIFSTFKLDELKIAGVNDDLLLKLKARNVSLCPPLDFTVSGLRNFFKKMLKEEETRKVEFFVTHRELDRLFDHQSRPKKFYVYISPDYCESTLEIQYTALQFKHFSAKLVPRNRHFSNIPSELCPYLLDFVASIEMDL